MIQDPEDDDAPLQPDKFIVSLYDGIGKGSAPDPEERGGKEGDEEKPEVNFYLIKKKIQSTFYS